LTFPHFLHLWVHIFCIPPLIICWFANSYSCLQKSLLISRIVCLLHKNRFWSEDLHLT
jgi:hypothetical protein